MAMQLGWVTTSQIPKDTSEINQIPWIWFNKIRSAITKFEEDPENNILILISSSAEDLRLMNLGFPLVSFLWGQWLDTLIEENRWKGKIWILIDPNKNFTSSMKLPIAPDIAILRVENPTPEQIIWVFTGIVEHAVGRWARSMIDGLWWPWVVDSFTISKLPGIIEDDFSGRVREGGILPRVKQK